MVIQALVLSGRFPAGIKGSISSSANSLNKILALSCLSLSDIDFEKKPSIPINKLSTIDASSATRTS